MLEVLRRRAREWEVVVTRTVQVGLLTLAIVALFAYHYTERTRVESKPSPAIPLVPPAGTGISTGDSNMYVRRIVDSQAQVVCWLAQQDYRVSTKPVTISCLPLSQTALIGE